MKPISRPLLIAALCLMVAGGSAAWAQLYQWQPPIGIYDWERVADRSIVRLLYANCSCYYSSDCEDTNRGTKCDYVGDCMGGTGCLCVAKPSTQINGVYICGDPEWGGQCDGVCVGARRLLAHWYFVSRFEVARFADLLFEAHLGAAREGGGWPKTEFLQEASRLELTGDWQLEVEGAVHHVLQALLGRDYLPPTAYGRAGGEPRGRVLKVNEAGIQLVDSVRQAFVAALAGTDPAESVDAAIKGFSESDSEYVPHHGGRCYPHGHPEYEEALPCLISEVRAALDLLLEGAEEARAK